MAEHPLFAKQDNAFHATYPHYPPLALLTHLPPFALRFSGFSYEDVMLGPVAEALGSALPTSMPIYFSMQGEMGATVFRCAPIL